MRWSETVYAVPSCWAHSETRYSSSIHRTRRSAAPGGRPVGQRGDLVQVRRLHVGHLRPSAARPSPPGSRAARGGGRRRRGTSGSGAAAPARPPPRTRGRPAGRPERACPACGEGEQLGPAADPLLGLPPGVQHPQHVGDAARPAARRRRRRAPARARRTPPGRAPAGGRRRPARRPRRAGRRPARRRSGTATRPAPAWPRCRGPPGGRRRRIPSRSRRLTPSRCRASASSAEPKTPQPDRRALVDEGREAAHLVAGPPLQHRLLDRAERPGRLPGRRQPDVRGDLGERGVEGRLQRRLERLEVLAAGLLASRPSSTTR